VDDAVGAEAFAGEASAASVAQARQIAADRGRSLWRVDRLIIT